MPAPVKAGAVLAGGGSLMTALYFVVGSRVFPIVLMGVVVVGLLLVVYKMVLKGMEKRKANPFAKSLEQNSAAAPQGISEPAKRARLDDLRKNFESGIEKFRAAGKNLYSTPWYLLVGEPGSGKTEAIRHCNVGFPPGLQDQLQGAGGTLNMNWWFTNHAIVLDTAGRLMFEEAPPGQTTEWQEFLRMLRQSRPNCPVNGMMLVIPADSLIRDTADQIEKKAGKVAQQLDSIQRILGVRFPAFIVITKCDLINGFREFFDNLDDPQLQHQMLGWSNPDDLDEPFRPELVEQHLSQVRERMIRRRTLMLQDPVHTENASTGRRIDQIDALYAFPDSLMNIAPRLRRYLEMIFVAGEWSSKPLFLRGIYFTSSMREGSALDAELAEALGVSVESLPEGRVWERDRAYFLRDLFMAKVFKERGLVTRAGNVRRTQQRRRTTVLAAGFTTVALLLGLTVYGAIVFRDSVGQELDFWRSAAGQVSGGAGELEILRPTLAGSLDYQFRGDAELEQVLARPTIAKLHPDVAKLVERPLGVPRVFRLVASISGDLESMRRAGASALFEASVLRPLLDAAGRKLAAETAESWTPAATQALAQLVRVESIGAGRQAGDDGVLLDLEALFRYVLPDGAGYDAATSAELRRVVGGLYTAESRAAGATASLQAPGRTGIERGSARFIEYWAAQGAGRTGRFAAVTELRKALVAYERAEAIAVRTDEGYAGGLEPETLAAHGAVTARWAEAYAALESAHAALADAVQRLGSELDQPIDRLCDAAATELLTRAKAEYDLITAQAGQSAPNTGSGESGAAPPLASALNKGWSDLEISTRDLSASLRQDIGRVWASHLERPAGSERRHYAIRHDMYALAQSRMAGSAGSIPQAFGEIAAGFGAWTEQTQQSMVQLGSLGALAAGSEPAANAGRVARFLVNVAQRHGAYLAADRVLSTTPASSAEFAAKVGELAQSGGYEQWIRPTLPLTGMQGGVFDIRYHPQAATRALSQWATLMRALAASPGSGGMLEAPALRERSVLARRVYEQYLREYVEYWSRTVPEVEAAVVDVGWGEFIAGLRSLRPFHVNGEIRRLLDRVQVALAAVPAEMASEPAVAAARSRVEREISELSNPRLDDVSRVVRDRWTSLGEDHGQARSTLLRLTREQFESEYLEIYADGDAGVRFWNDVFVAGLRILAGEAQRDARQAIAKLVDEYDAFPVCAIESRERVLSKASVAAIGELVSRVGQIGANATPPGSTLGAGARTASDRINEQLVRLTGEDLFRNPAEREWARRMRVVASFLQPSPQTCEIVILSSVEQDRVPQAGLRTATTIYSLIEIGAGEQPAFEPFSTRDVARGRLPQVTLPGETVVIRFRKTSLDEPEKPLTFPGPWNLVALAQMPGAVVEQVPGGGSLLKVPLVFADAGGQRFYYWIGVRFERPVPALGDWPTRESWPAK
jgi:hypothetical protein